MFYSQGVALVLGCILLGGALPAWSEDRAVLENLALAAKAPRRVFLFDLYTCSIYLEDIRTMNANLSDQEGAIIRLDVHGKPPKQLPKHWEALLDAELSDNLFREVMRHYRYLKEGDVVWVKYVPGEGTSVMLNDIELFVDPGPDLTRALLAQWVGEEPVSEEFKRELLASFDATGQGR